MSNWGQAILTVVGFVIGWFVGYPMLGLYLGSLAGQAFFPTELPGISGPKLTDLRTTSADVGAPVMEVFGTDIVPGQVIWLAPVRTVETKEEQGGKGGGSTQTVTTYTYFQSIAVGLCRADSEIGGIRRVWENGKLVYDVREQLENESDAAYDDRLLMSDNYFETFNLHLGGPDQDPDPTIEAIEGVDNTPGMSGLAYIVYPERQLLDSQGRRHPNFRFEVTPTDPICIDITITAGVSGTLQGYGVAGTHGLTSTIGSISKTSYLDRTIKGILFDSSTQRLYVYFNNDAPLNFFQFRSINIQTAHGEMSFDINADIGRWESNLGRVWWQSSDNSELIVATLFQAGTTYEGALCRWNMAEVVTTDVVIEEKRYGVGAKIVEAHWDNNGDLDIFASDFLIELDVKFDDPSAHCVAFTYGNLWIGENSFRVYSAGAQLTVQGFGGFTDIGMQDWVDNPLVPGQWHSIGLRRGGGYGFLLKDAVSSPPNTWPDLEPSNQTGNIITCGGDDGSPIQGTWMSGSIRNFRVHKLPRRS